jgi:dinuclear metal center YbgI/SA1388 family protein
MKVSALLTQIDRLAPFLLTESWDRVGLQVGRRERQVGALLVGLDLNDELLDEAARTGADVLLVHHPPLHASLEALTDETPMGSALLRAVHEDRVVIACHTNLDKARGGLADIACTILGLEGVAPLAPSPVDWLKLVGFVPPDDLDAVRTAVFAVGGGVIGDYEHCSFHQPGTGTFLPRQGAAPAVGSVGQDNATGELRLEVVFPRSRRRAVLDAYVASHSYEEPAYDVYPVENEVGSVGLGRLGFLPRPMDLGDLAATAARHFEQSTVRHTGDPTHRVQSVAVLPGSGAELIDAVVGRADVLLTGDVKYHEAERALRLGLPIIDVPHEVVEAATLERWTDVLADHLAGAGVSVGWCAGYGGIWHYSEDEYCPPRPRDDFGPVQVSLDEAAGEPSRFRLSVDGGARGNPGPAGIGVRLESPDGELVEELSAAIGTATNNQAEYEALIAGLELAIDRGATELLVFADSELIVRQVNGQYRVKDAKLKPLHERATRLIRDLPYVELRHVPREQNTEADRLVNEAIDEALKH